MALDEADYVTAGFKPVTVNEDERSDYNECYKITALNCVSDTQAFYVWDISMVHGINIPKEISITGMDNMREGVRERGLTTIKISLEQSGRQAFEIMMELIKEGYGSVGDVTLPF